MLINFLMRPGANLSDLAVLSLHGRAAGATSGGPLRNPAKLPPIPTGQQLAVESPINQLRINSLVRQRDNLGEYRQPG